MADHAGHRVIVFTAKGLFVRVLGNNGMLRHPIGVAVNEGGEVFVCDESGRVLVFAICDGSLLRVFSGEGEGEGQMLRPCAVAVSPVDGTVLVVDQGTSQVQVFSSAGVWISSVGQRGDAPGQLRVPLDVAVCPFSGHVVVATLFKIVVFEKGGQFVQEIRSVGNAGGRQGLTPGDEGFLNDPFPGGRCGKEPRGVCVGADGTICVVVSDIMNQSGVLVLASQCTLSLW